MKTFTLVSLQVATRSHLKDISLIDGLIINKENERKNWIIEVFTHSSHQSFFQKLYDDKRSFTVHAVISHRTNDPALFAVTIRSFQIMGEQMNVVMKGTLLQSRGDYAELLLKELLEDGLTGEALMQSFKQRMHTRPKLNASE